MLYIFGCEGQQRAADNCVERWRTAQSSNCGAVMSESENRKMTVTIQVRSTPTEKALLKARANAFGISVGELVRETIFRTTPKSKTDVVAIQVLAASRADLGRLGGLLKGWLGGSFPNSSSPDQMPIRALLHKIEIVQAEILDAVKKLVSKSS